MSSPPEADLRRLFDRAPVGFYRSTVEGRFLYANPALVAMLGYERADDVLALDMPTQVYLNAADRARLIEDYRARGVVDGVVVRWRTRSGAPLVVQLYGTMVDDERGPGFEVTVIDVTALHAAEAEVVAQRGLTQRIEAALHILIDQVPAVIGTIDRDLRFTSVAGSGLAALGLTVDQVLGRTMVDLVADGDHDDAVSRTRAVLAGSIEQFEYVFAGRTLAVSAAPLRDARAVIGAVLVGIDVTEARRFEARMQAAQRAESLGILAGGVAHDFNNLLVAMLGNADLALLELAPDAPARASVDSIRTAALRAAELTSQLLAVAGRSMTSIQPVDLRDVVDELVLLLRPTFPPEVAADVALAAVPPVKADPTQLRQVMLNLIANARDAIAARVGAGAGVAGGRASADGGGDGAIAGGGAATAAGSMSVRAILLRHDGAHHDDDVLPPPAGTHVVIEVSDDGAGMDDATRRRIFEPFFTTKARGHGLGLAAVLGIVRGHGGGIRVSSAPGRGTLFQIFWPAAVTHRASGPHRVLVVDDEQMVRDVVCRMLGDIGYDTAAAPDGAAALNRLRAGDRFDAMILDLTMPGMSGRELITVLRTEIPHLPVIVCSGHLRDGAETLGASFLAKPFHFDDLVAAIEAVVRAR
jgi:two-component system cell cycle sensor histidine kinase/response regulator CckA